MALTQDRHRAVQHRSAVPGVEAVTLSTDRSFPRHAHDQLGFGVVAFGAHRSWSGVGAVEAAPGDCIMVNPGEIHDGIAVDGGTRGWPPSPGAPGPAAPSATRFSRGRAGSPDASGARAGAPVSGYLPSTCATLS